MNEENLTTRQRFEKELGQISFQELQKFFAKGMMIMVSDQLPIIDVAMSLHDDDVQQIQQWIDDEQVVRAHDEHAKEWVVSRTEFNAVTVAPWVLVQEIHNEE
ncbi:DUF2288 family protein [Marinicella litoralis]|nr:DUF2288 family protein [Marinicella litoralis]